MCSLAGTFEVRVTHDALISGLVDAVAQSRGISNARRVVAVFIAGEEEPLVGTQSVADCMAEAGANELFMLVRLCNDRLVLEDIYNSNAGAGWDSNGGWMTDAPLGNWHGVTADADENATDLDLGGNKAITRLPDSLEGITCLQNLNLNGCCRLSMVPASIGQCKALVYLGLGGTAIPGLHEALGELASLHTLKLNNCSKLSSLPTSLGNLTNLHKLDLRDCPRLGFMPESIGELVNLKDLRLAGCSALVQLPEALGGCVSLRMLTLNETGIIRLPHSLGELASLKTLKLHECSNLKELPESIGLLTNLQELNVSWCPNLEGHSSILPHP
jgi:Leucine-rich repeat (LRR) protein